MEDAERELGFLKANRKHYRTKATKKCNYVENNLLTLSPQQMKDEIVDLKKLEVKLQGCDRDISRVIWKIADEARMTSEIEDCDRYETILSSAIQSLEAHLPSPDASGRNSSMMQNNDSVHVSNHTNLRLPQIPLPEYSRASGETLEMFLYSFESIVDKYNLSSYEKFVLLQRQLKNEPLSLIKSLGTEGQSYGAAKELLCRAFSSPINQQFDILNRLLNLKMNNPNEPYEFISEMRILIDSFKRLSIDEDTVIQFFVWRGMSDSFKEVFITVTNNTNPNLETIQSEIFAVTERYLHTQPKVKHVREHKVVGLAANVGSSREFRPCCLCLADSVSVDHAIFKCTTYPSSSRKLAKLKSIRSCQRCAYSHETEYCNFKFKRPCRYCNKFHFDFLCDKEYNQNCSTPNTSNDISSRNKQYVSGEKYTKVNDTNNSNPNYIKLLTKPTFKPKNPNSVTMNSASAMLSFDSCKNVILPTFCFNIKHREIRALKDSGCQCNFILEKIAVQEKLEIVEETNVTVNGFNSSQKFKSKVVKFTGIFGGVSHEILAITIPHINTSFKIPGIKAIAREFDRKHYKLADPNLLRSDGSVNNIEFIFGACFNYCIPENTVLFGRGVKSSYIDTPVGVMLVGPVDNVTSNLRYLSSRDSSDDDPLHSEFSYPESDDKSLSVSGFVSNIEMDEQVEHHYCSNDRLSSTNPYDCTSSYESCSVYRSGDCSDFNVGANYAVIGDDGKLNQSELLRATEDAINRTPDKYLDSKCREILNYDDTQDIDAAEINEVLIDRVLENCKLSDDNRLILPLTWNDSSHFLADNFNLSKQILGANLRKLRKEPEKLEMVDKVFREQAELEIIERIENLDSYMLEHPETCFLPHMPVFRMNKETSKCRVVYLSNLASNYSEKAVSLSNNQCMHSGPCLNRKLSTSLLNLRFDRYLLCFDLVKAFLQIELFPSDQKKLCFLWYRNVKAGDFSIVGYISKRLPFGLKCSPFLLMIALYKILMVDTETQSNDIRCLKKQLYNLFYMDNGAITSNDKSYIEWACSNLAGIFNPYSFDLQQYVTNIDSLQQELDTQGDSQTGEVVKLLGLNWNRVTDMLSTVELSLDEYANTKRRILSSIASNFDIYNFNGPLLNRARLFMHDLQCRPELGWDTAVAETDRKTWRTICRQVNNSAEIALPRCVGRREDNYHLVAFTDSSKSMLGVVLYLYNIDNSEVNFVLSRNKIVGRNLEDKSIPSLEFQAILLGTETIYDTYFELTGEACVVPVNITKCELYTDSLVCLNWLNQHSKRIDKSPKKSIFVQNRLSKIDKLCAACPIEFKFCSGSSNPADCTTREISYKCLIKSNFLSGPEILFRDPEHQSMMNVKIPNPVLSNKLDLDNEVNNVVSVDCANVEKLPEDYLNTCDYSTYEKTLKVAGYVIKFCNKLKARISCKFKVNVMTDAEIERRAFIEIIRGDQARNFQSELSYCNNPVGNMNMPILVSQLNLYIDDDGLIRVKSKFGRWKHKPFFPILLSKSGFLTEKIVTSFHIRLSHSGLYSVLNDVRKQFWIPNAFSTIRKILRTCVVCRRFNNRPVSINQNSYRDFRVNPPKVPFRTIFVDYIGPFLTKVGKVNEKRYLLCFTCTWSRAINLKVCTDMTVEQFLRSFQLHVFEWGVPEKCYSDLGTQIVAGGNTMMDFISDEKTKAYFSDKGMSSLVFEQFDKGRKELGSIVESCVKLVKRLISKSIRKLVLPDQDFYFLVNQTLSLVNRRPITFTEGLRSGEVSFPSPITPEMLLKGYELPSINLIPQLQTVDEDPSWECDSAPVETIFSKLRETRSRMIKLYNEEMFTSLLQKATDRKDRYHSVTHEKLLEGDVVLLKEDNFKPVNYPVAIVKQITVNDLNETTGVLVLKGATRELVRRHVSSVIPILKKSEYTNKPPNISDESVRQEIKNSPVESKTNSRPRRAAAECGIRKTRALMEEGVV